MCAPYTWFWSIELTFFDGPKFENEFYAVSESISLLTKLQDDIS